MTDSRAFLERLAKVPSHVMLTPVVGYEGLYEVSDQGEVFSFNYIGHKRRGQLTGGMDHCGYKKVGLSKNGVIKSFLIHRLVAIAFLGKPKAGMQANHKNGIKTDNRLENLEWVTRSENVKHAYRELGRARAMTGVTGAANPTSKPVYKYSLADDFIEKYAGVAEAARQLGLNDRAISAAATGRTKTSGGFIWKYA